MADERTSTRYILAGGPGQNETVDERSSLAAAPRAAAGDPRLNDRVRKAEVRVAKDRAAVAKRQARLAGAEAVRVRAETRLSRDEEALDLARRGLKRQFLTGRIVPVRGSARARPHRRRLFGGRDED